MFLIHLGLHVEARGAVNSLLQSERLPDNKGTPRAIRVLRNLGRKRPQYELKNVSKERTRKGQID